MNTNQTITAMIQLPLESQNQARDQREKRGTVHLTVTIKPGSGNMKNALFVHFEIPPRYRSSFSCVSFRYQHKGTEYLQTGCEGWAATDQGVLDTNSIFLCLKYI